MTKQQFLSGKEFMYNNQTDTCFRYENDSVLEMWYFKGEILSKHHHTNVESVGTKYFTYYTYVLGKRVSGKINFLNL